MALSIINKQTYDKLVIKDEELKLFKSFLILEKEVCGTFEITTSGVLMPNNSNIGETVIYNNITREMCISPNAPYIWHTHPYISFSIPSVEDIIHVIKHLEIQSSIIITTWGIWEIYKVKNFDSSIVKNKKMLDFFNKKIDEIIKYLITKTRIPRNERHNNYKNRMDLDNFLNDIYLSIDNLNNLLVNIINIFFTDWNSLPI